MRGEPELLAIARELTEQVRANITTDRTVSAHVRTQLRILVKRILRTRGYPPDAQTRATEHVLEQAEALGALDDCAKD